MITCRRTSFSCGLDGSIQKKASKSFDILSLLMDLSQFYDIYKVYKVYVNPLLLLL
jgi:hypothetical protein